MAIQLTPVFRSNRSRATLSIPCPEPYFPALPGKEKSLANVLFTRLFAFLSWCLAVRRGFYPNPRNAPCIKWLHALPNEAGYTLVTRFHTSKSASLNALSMNLYTANVTSFSGSCKWFIDTYSIIPQWSVYTWILHLRLREKDIWNCW